MSKRHIGKHSVTGKNIYSYKAKFGPVIQLGEDDDPDKKYVGIKNDTTITLSEANQLLTYPKKLGEYKSENVILKKGKFGFYLSHDNKNYKILSNYDEFLSLDEAVECIISKNKSIIKTFQNNSISVRVGKYGPYILYEGKFVNIPPTIKPEDITEKECMELLNNFKVSIKKKN